MVIPPLPSNIAPRIQLSLLLPSSLPLSHHHHLSLVGSRDSKLAGTWLSLSLRRLTIRSATQSLEMTTRFPSPPPHYNNTNAARDDQFSNSNDHHNYPTSTVNFDAVQPAPVPHRSALTPYLTLPHYLSLSWLAYPIISLLFVAFRLVDSTSSAHDGVADAKTDLMASCLAAQRAASSAASMPRYLAIGSNDAIQASVDAAMDAARLTMILRCVISVRVARFLNKLTHMICTA